MRRLAAVLALALALPVAPGAQAARPPAARPVPFVEGGTISVGPVREDERLLRALEPMAVTPESKKVLERLARTGSGGAGEPQRMVLVLEAPDLDGNGATDLLVYDTEFAWVDLYIEGDTTLTAYDGRTGRGLWRRTLEGLPIPLPYYVKVGRDRGRQGVVLTSLDGAVSRNGGVRIVSLGGARGETVFDRTITEADGLGEVHFAGFLDAVPNGGDDMVIARTQYIGVESSVTVAGIRWPQADLSQLFVVDGKDGRMFQGSERMLGLGGWVGFVAGGDYDLDKRDDVLVVRWGIRGRGTVTARSLTEDRVLWTNESVPLGSQVLLQKPDADYAGDRREDVVLQSRLGQPALVSVPGVTDEMVVFAHDPEGKHAVLLDGRDGATLLDRWDADFYWAAGDVNRDGKADLMALDVFVDDRRGGFRFSVGTGAGRDLYTSEVSLPADAARLTGVGGITVSAGDVDGDRLTDVWYDVLVGSTTVTLRRARGFLLTRTGRTIATTDYPLGGALDGRGADRYGFAAATDGGETFFMRDGLTGRSYWKVFGRTEKDTYLGFAPVSGARGRCANVVAVTVGAKDHAGEVWGVGLDGRTGRIVWSKSLNDSADRPTVLPRGGAPAPC